VVVRQRRDKSGPVLSNLPLPRLLVQSHSLTLLFANSGPLHIFYAGNVQANWSIAVPEWCLASDHLARGTLPSLDFSHPRAISKIEHLSIRMMTKDKLQDSLVSSLGCRVPTGDW
jgi:hypothetical protein